MIAMSLTLIMLGLVTQALVTAGRYQSRLFQSTELETNCIKALEHLTRDISESQLKAITCSGDTIIFPAPRNPDGSLSLDIDTSAYTWATLVCYRLDRPQRLIERKYESLTPELQAPEAWLMNPVRNAPYFILNGQRSRALTADVEDFQVSFLKKDGSDADSLPDIATRTDAEFVQIELELKIISPKPIGIEAHMSVVPRN